MALSNLFNFHLTSGETLELTLQGLRCPSVRFDRFSLGINNVHIDVCFTTHFDKHTEGFIRGLLTDYCIHKKRKLSPQTHKHSDNFKNSYASMLRAALSRAKEGKNIDVIQLFEIAILKYLTVTVRILTEEFLHKIKNKTVSDEIAKSHQGLELYDLITWATKNKSYLIYQVTSELFTALRWVEAGDVGKWRADLLGVAWSIPEAMLFNPLLRSLEPDDSELLLDQYVLMSSQESIQVSLLLDELLDEVSKFYKVTFSEEYSYPTEKKGVEHFSWKDVPANSELLFNINATTEKLQEACDQKDFLKKRLPLQQKALELLEEKLKESRLFLKILAAYETKTFYHYYDKTFTAMVFFQILCNETDADYLLLKLENQLKVNPLRDKDGKPLTIAELVNGRKRLHRAARKIENTLLIRFVKDVTTYRRDLKYFRLTQTLFERINVLQKSEDIQLSRSNGILYEFLEESEYGNEGEQQIRGHVILKADVRGSTTITSELRKRGLNPATHFSLYFFDPIRELINQFGAEKVFIEGDAVILSWFEFHNLPEQWVATARACGLAKNMIEVVKAQNKTCIEHHLPPLELGIGICYAAEAPAFLYDDDQRIMISPAIGDADRLSSCSWKLRHQYANKPNLLTHVMVFQKTEEEKGEKGMTTFRYNLNGIELEVAAFKKLQTEIALKVYRFRLPDDPVANRFFIGQFPDAFGEKHQIVVREGFVSIWQDHIEYYPVTNEVYYEVVTNPRLLSSVKKMMTRQVIS